MRCSFGDHEEWAKPDKTLKGNQPEEFLQKNFPNEASPSSDENHLDMESMKGPSLKVF